VVVEAEAEEVAVAVEVVEVAEVAEGAVVEGPARLRLGVEPRDPGLRWDSISSHMQRLAGNSE
jgi:hypothetical protein